MPYLDWKDSLSIGIRTIDVQHRKLVEMVNALHDAVETPGAAGQACPGPELVARLKAYAAEHFHIEEGYMQSFAYPEFAAHQKEHEDFIAAAQGFEDACAKGKADATAVLEFLKTWLVTHITGVDVQMGRFLKDYLR